MQLESVDRSVVEKYGKVVVEAVVGSQSFGLATPTSDVDVHGVFILGDEQKLRYNAPDEIADKKNNTVYWELSKFLYLLNNANPQALELLYSPEHCIRLGKDLLDKIRSDMDFLTMRCKSSFIEYARGQISRAKGLNKKIWNPMPEEKPRLVQYIYVLEDNLAVPLLDWIGKHYPGVKPTIYQKWFAISAIDHADSIYAMYIQDGINSYHGDIPEHEWRWAYGVVRDVDKSEDVQLNSIPKGLQPVAHIAVNRNAFAKDCKKWAEYWEWVKKRNSERYETTIKHGQGYDAKNMMHCIRLLLTARDIPTKHTIVVDRTEARDFLLGIKGGSHTYDAAMEYVERLATETADAFDRSGLKTESYSMEELSDYLVGLHKWINGQKSDWKTLLQSLRGKGTMAVTSA